MRRAAEQIKSILKGILLIGFAIQAVLGLWWMCANFNDVQYFGKPEEGLYSVLYRMTGQIPQIMYILQLSFGLWGGWRSLAGFLPGWRAWWGSLALLTYPMAMQCHLAVLPHSFVTSLFLGNDSGSGKPYRTGKLSEPAEHVQGPFQQNRVADYLERSLCLAGGNPGKGGGENLDGLF